MEVDASEAMRASGRRMQALVWTERAAGIQRESAAALSG